MKHSPQEQSLKAAKTRVLMINNILVQWFFQLKVMQKLMMNKIPNFKQKQDQYY